MAIKHPEKYYRGVFSDTRNWDRFEHRPGDIFICVPPKSGTTWMQTICGLLIFGDPDAQISYTEISPWIEFSLVHELVDQRLEMLSAQTHQRFIKSHSPLDGVPYYEDAIYLICHRHPLDVHFSMWNHVQNMKLENNDHLYTDDLSANFEAFLANGIDGDGFDQPSLALLAHHLNTALAIADRPNVHLFHYDETSRDLPGQMQRIAAAIGVSHTDDLFKKLVVKATFKSMKETAHLSAPGAGAGLWDDPSTFFQSGKGGKWEGKLDNAQLANYKAKLAALLSEEEIGYFERGTLPT